MPLPLNRVVFLLALGGCGLNPDHIADHRLFADDGDQVRASKNLSFAVVGNLRPTLTWEDRILARRPSSSGVTEALIQNLSVSAASQRLSFLVLMGDDVRASTGRQWKLLDQRLKDVVDGDTLPTETTRRVPVIPVAGEHEFRFDRFLRGMEGAFPGVGADIGYNRFASWSCFDAEVAGVRWRFLVLDTNKSGLGPRWSEQLYWIPKAVEGEDYESLIVFMHAPLGTLAAGRESNRDGAPKELLDTVEESIGLMKLRAVFTADPSTTEAFLVGGRYGTLHVNAGGGGAPPDDLQRWGSAQSAGIATLKLEPIFDAAILNAFSRDSRDLGFPESIIDASRGEGSYEGFPAILYAKYFPLFGYWLLDIEGSKLSAVFRFLASDGSFRDLYQVDYQGDQGWRIGS